MEEQTQIKVGNGLTMCVGTDRYSYTIISYENNILEIQEDINNLPDINGFTMLLKKYVNRHTMEIEWYRVVLNEKTGRYNKIWKKPERLRFGIRDSYYDPSF